MADITLDTPDTPYSKSYAIIVSSSTFNDNEWSSVVSHLYELHPNAVNFVYSDGDLKSVDADLKQMMPRYVAFICKPEECGRVFVAECHRLMRSLDNDPYIDAMWSIITGSDAEHALKSIDNESICQPFIIRNAINFLVLEQKLFEKCVTFSDSKKGYWFTKNTGIDDGSGEEKYEGEQFPEPPAKIFRDKLIEIEPDLIVTTGHGTEQYIEMPWSLGKLEVESYGLVPIDENSTPVAPIIECSVNPKVFLPIGNCLIGHCSGPQCMVTTFLGRMGVRQMCGYTVPTWAGHAGWGTFDLWKSVPSRLTLADAFFLHQAQMTYDLKSINPRLLDFQYNISANEPDYDTVVEQIDQQYHIANDKIDDQTLHKIYGLCYDRDTFVFYGDPAFIVKFHEGQPLLTTKFLRLGHNKHQFIIEYKDKETAQSYSSSPIGSLFTSRIENYNIINGFEYEPILADNFIIIRKPIPRDRNSRIIKIDFRGTIINS